jgi:hypothetical protein
MVKSRGDREQVQTKKQRPHPAEAKVGTSVSVEDAGFSLPRGFEKAG